jgi:hypothetical protein
LAPGLLALLAPSVGERMAELARRVDPLQPYWPAEEPLLVYASTPLAVFGALWLVLAPGRALARRAGLGSSFATRLPFALAFSLATLVPLVWILRFVFGAPLDALTFTLSALALGAPLEWAANARPAGSQERGAEPIAMFAAGIAFLVALVPKFFFESFNGDGAHAFEASRLLLHQPLPFWPAGAGEVGAFPGLNSVLFTFPNAWFLALFGEHESAVRVPLVLYLLVLYGCIAALCEHGAPRKLDPSARALIGAGVASFGLIQAYSATYDPYCSDIGLPATQDSLTMIACFGAGLALARRSAIWTCVFAGMTLLASPNGALLVAVLAAAAFASTRPITLAPWIPRAAAVLLALALFVAAPRLLEALGLPAPGAEHSSTRLLDKFKHLQVWDPQRFLFLALPAGVYPMLGFLAWRSGDAVVRTWILVTLAVFATFYALAYVSLHYFVPVMLTPLVFFWRARLVSVAEGRPLLSSGAFASCALLASLSVVLALPASSAIYTSSRDVGELVALEGLEGYERCEPAAFEASDLLAKVFTPGWNPKVPGEAHAGSSIAWNFYAQRARARPGERVFVLRANDLAPRDAPAIEENASARLYVLDERRARELRALQPTNSLGRSLYLVPRAVLFGRREAAQRPGVFHLGS